MTTITSSEKNRTIIVHLDSPGETVVRVWDAADPRLQTFVRISAEDPLPVSHRSILVSDVRLSFNLSSQIVCLKSPIGIADEESHPWTATDRKLKVDGNAAVALADGVSHLTVEVAPNQVLLSTVGRSCTIGMI